MSKIGLWGVFYKLMVNLVIYFIFEKRNWVELFLVCYKSLKNCDDIGRL